MIICLYHSCVICRGFPKSGLQGGSVTSVQEDMSDYGKESVEKENALGPWKLRQLRGVQEYVAKRT